MDHPRLPIQPTSLKTWLQAASRRHRGLSDRRGVVTLEFAIIALPFTTCLLFIFALGLHFFFQELLDTGLHFAAGRIETGNAQNLTGGNAFVKNYLCPAMGNLVNCSNLVVKVQKITYTNGQDYYNVTTGRLPVTGNVLNLAGYGNADFCNAGQSQFVLVTAIYMAPSILGQLVPNVFSVNYGGKQVDAIMSQTAGYTENYAGQVAGATPAGPC